MGKVGTALVAVLALHGCATSVKEIRHHPDQARLERLLAGVLPHTQPPGLHYWVRVSEPTEHPIGLATLPQRHLYIAASLLKDADDRVLTALLAHGVAHHRLHHYGARNVVQGTQRVAFKVGGAFVPGLSHGHYVGGPLTEVFLSAGQEPAADAKTVTYLTRMGYGAADLRRALEFLRDQGYAERIGHITMRGRDFTNRIEALRHDSAPGDEHSPD